VTVVRSDNAACLLAVHLETTIVLKMSPIWYEGFFSYLLRIFLLQIFFLSKMESFVRAFPLYSQIGIVFPAGKSGEFYLNLSLNCCTIFI